MSQLPRAPSHLDAAGKATWKRLVGELPDTTPGSLLALEQASFAWSKWLAAHGEDSKLRWSRCCRQWLSELKLTPRTNTTRKSTEDSGDPILKLIHRAE